MSIVLGYWDLRGLADSIRLLLVDNKVNFEDKRYSDATEWFGKDKPSLGLDFPNLPYLIDGDVKLTMSAAILRYLGRKLGLAGKTEQETQKLDMLEQDLFDLNMQMARVWYSDKESYDAKVKLLLENLPKRIEELSKYLGDNCCLLGSKITYVDYLMYTVLDYVRLFQPQVFDKSNLKAFMDRVEARSNLKDYLKSPEFLKQRVTAPIALWSGLRSE